MKASMDILLVEDSPSDAFITREALKDPQVPHVVHQVEDGVEAMAFLRREGNYRHVPRPDLILLDLNTPRKDGREVLAEIKADNHLKSIPVIVLTSSGAQSDIHNAYQLHANCYITKPTDFERFKAVIRSLEDFWFSCATLPSNE
jgi:two-component system, chemotaxis family, response regulator Rcp1